VVVAKEAVAAVEMDRVEAVLDPGARAAAPAVVVEEGKAEAILDPEEDPEVDVVDKVAVDVAAPPAGDVDKVALADLALADLVVADLMVVVVVVDLVVDVAEVQAEVQAEVARFKAALLAGLRKILPSHGHPAR